MNGVVPCSEMIIEMLCFGNVKCIVIATSEFIYPSQLKRDVPQKSICSLYTK